MHKAPNTMHFGHADPAPRTALPSASRVRVADRNDEEFEEFLSSIAVSQEELIELIRSPECTVQKLRQRRGRSGSSE